MWFATLVATIRYIEVLLEHEKHAPW